MLTEPHGDAQPALDLGITSTEPLRVDAWWVAAIEHETEGDQDTGWWDA